MCMRWFVWLLSGLCLALISVNQVFWWLAFLGLFLFIYAITRALSWHEAALGGLLVGTLKAMGGYAWGWSAYPMVWVTLGKLGQILLISAYWLSTSSFAGLGIAAATVLLFLIWQKNRIFFFALIPVLWLAGEILGSFTASIILLGPNVPLNSDVVHGYVGIALANISLFYPFSSITGIYGLTVVVVALSAFGYFVWTHAAWGWTRKVFWYGYCATALLIFYVIFPTTPLPAVEKTIVAIDTRFSVNLLHGPDGEKIKASNEITAVLAAAKTAPDIILLPEDARLTDYLGGTEAALTWLDSRIDTDVVVVDSVRVEDEEGAVLRAVYYDLGKQAVYMTDKQFLIPQGEYITYPFILGLKLLGRDEDWSKILNNQNYHPGKQAGYDKFPADIPGVLFCSESSYIGGISRIANLRESPVVLHVISHARFNDPDILWYQLDAMIRTQAIYTKKIVISSGNVTPSKLYGPDGRIVRGEVILSTEFFDLVEYNL